MKIFNILYIMTLLLLINACQARNMPINNDIKLTTHVSKKKKIRKKSFKTSNIRTVKKQKKTSYKKVLSKKKIIVQKKKIRKKYSPVLPHTASKKSLSALPIIPSITQIKKTSHIKKLPSISQINESDKILNSIPLPKESFSGGGMINNLDMGAIRIGKSPDYTSIIFDSYKYISKNTLSTQKSSISGTYLFTYEPSKNRIIGFIDGYRDFSALKEDQHELFRDSKVVKNIYVLKHMGRDGIKFVIKLRKKVRANIFDVKNPGRIIVNLFPE